MKILIVDDDEGFLHDMQCITVQGCEIATLQVSKAEQTHQSAGEVVQQIRAHNPDLIFLDEDMEGIYGQEVAAQLNFPREKVVGTSSTHEQPYVGRRFGKHRAKVRLPEFLLTYQTTARC